MLNYTTFITEGLSLKKQFINAIYCNDIDRLIKIFNTGTIDNRDKNFLERLKKRDYVIDYYLQKELIKRNEIDLIMFLYDNNLIDDRIKKLHPHLFNSRDLNLL